MVSTPPEWPPLSLTFPFLNHRAKSKISEFWKNEKNCLRHHHFTHAYQKTKIRWGMVSEIHSETHKNFLSFWAIFCTLTSLTTLEIKIKKKKKKKVSGNVIILFLCTKIHDHMMYASWDLECDRHNFLSFRVIFCLFTPLLTSKIWKKFQKTPGYIILWHICP